MTGDELKSLRRRLGLTQHVFASRLGVTRMTVYRWERRGPVALPLKIVRMITRAAASKPARATPAPAVEHVTRAGDAQAVYAIIIAADVASALQRLADMNRVEVAAYANAVLRGHANAVLPPQFTRDPWS